MKKQLLTALILTSLAGLPAWHGAAARDWPMFGGNLANTANGAGETVISRSNVAKLKPKWVLTTTGDVSARAAVVGGKVYFPDWGGSLWAVNAATGKVVWHRLLSSYGLPAKTVSRTSPTVVAANGLLYIGTQTGAYLLAVETATGKLKWKTLIDNHPEAIVTGSPAAYGGVVYVGVSSNEETAASTAKYKCCSFRGSMAGVNANTGKILWKTFTAPADYTGAAVWGSNPVVDPALKKIFIGTGDNYSKPTAPAYLKCIADGGTEPKCLSPDDHVDSMLALEMGTGKVAWSRRLRNDDDWNVACFVDKPGQGNCPKGAGPDYDFGSAPNEFTVAGKKVIGAGQKSGIYTAFNPETGAIIWSKQVGPGSFLGGIEWGSAIDNTRLYVAISNFDREKSAAGTAGSWSALEPATGKTIWQVPDPNGTIDLAPMAVSNGVVYAGSMTTKTTQPDMFALDAGTGKVLWRFNSGASVISGAVISGGVVYWGSGYSHFGPPYIGNNKFYAFSIDGK
jgi:polyvinyl alcohol dehydrogenase (cytochrome)